MEPHDRIMPAHEVATLRRSYVARRPDEPCGLTVAEASRILRALEAAHNEVIDLRYGQASRHD